MVPVTIDYRRCTGCKSCYRECPSDLFGWDEERQIPYVAYPDECWLCGICKLECPEDALKFTLPPEAWTDINKRYLSKLGAPTEFRWPEDE